MTATRTLHVSTPYQESAAQGRIILRDGSTATIRLSTSDDRFIVRDFYRQMSAASRRFRFFSETKPGENVIDPLCDSSDPARQMTLLVFRHGEDGPRVVATASYIGHDAKTAEFAVAVDDSFHGRGLGGILLERLAVIADAQGFVRFVAVVDPSNRGMLDTFRNSGFAIKERFEEDCIHIDIDVTPREASIARAELRDRLFTRASIAPIFNPRSVAVIGASRDTRSFGYRIMEALVMNRFAGPVYPVNPNADVICSIRAYPRVSAIPDPVDLAIIAVPKDAVLAAVDDCALRGVRAVIVISAGFAELNEDGARLQRELVDKVRGYGMRLVGPNCLGLINTAPEVRLNASFSPAYPPHGRVALSSQSGALGLAILSLARQRQLGLSMFISMGNKADVTGNDLLQFWEEDASTDVILLYLESFGNPRRFARLARRVSRRKPIVCVKSGRHRKISDIAVDALFRQTGVIRADTLEEMFDVAAVLGNQPLPKGRRVSIVTNSHGSGVLCMDTCEAGGLEVSGPSEETAARLRAVLPEGSSIGPIVDLSGNASPAHYQQTIEQVLVDPNTDALIASYIPLGVADAGAFQNAFIQAVSIARTRGGQDKPVLAVMMSGEGMPGLLDPAGQRIPRFLFPETAARALAIAVEYQNWRSGPQGDILAFEDARPDEGRAVCRGVLKDDAKARLDDASVTALFGSFGIVLGSSTDASSSSLNLTVTEDTVFGPILCLQHADARSQHEAGNVRVMPLTDRDARELCEAVDETEHPAELAELLLRLSMLVEEVPEISSIVLARLTPSDGGWTAQASVDVATPRRIRPQT